MPIQGAAVDIQQSAGLGRRISSGIGNSGFFKSHILLNFIVQ